LLDYIICTDEIINETSRLEIVQYLIEEKNINTMTENDENITPLMSSIFFGKLNIVYYLLNNIECDVFYADKHNSSALVHIIASNFITNENEKLNLLKNLIEIKNIDFDFIQNNTENILHTSAEFGYFEIIRFLIENTKINVNQKDNSGNTALYRVIVSERINLSHKFELIKYFIQIKNIDINIQNSFSTTALLATIFSGYLDIAEFLIKNIKNIDVNLVDDNENSILHALLTIQEQENTQTQLEIFKFLVGDANVFKVNNRGESILHACAYYGNLEILKYVLKTYKLNVNLQDFAGKTAIIHTILSNVLLEHEKILILKVLIENFNANINLSDFAGISPLATCFERQQYMISQYLLQNKFHVKKL